MKKMMVALVGIVSVLMLASCEKVVEIDGDVSIAKTDYSYRMEITGTASYVLAEQDSDGNWKAKDGAKSVELVVDGAGCWLNWDNYKYTNQKDYWYGSMWFADAPDGKEGLTERMLFAYPGDSWYEKKLCEYKGVYYLGDVNPSFKVTVTGSPSDNEFSVAATNSPRYCWIDSEGKSAAILLTYSLTFSR